MRNLRIIVDNFIGVAESFPGDSDSATLVCLHKASELVVGDRRWADVPEVLASRILEDGLQKRKGAVYSWLYLAWRTAYFTPLPAALS